jgi:hypothetical protein
MIKQGQRTGTGSQRPILRIREPLSSAFIRDTEPKQWQTNPRDLDAEMMTRLPVATAEDHRNLFMAFDGVVGSMQGADALPLAGSIGGIRRGLAPRATWTSFLWN